MSHYFISLWYPLELGTFLISEDPPRAQSWESCHASENSVFLTWMVDQRHNHILSRRNMSVPGEETGEPEEPKYPSKQQDNLCTCKHSVYQYRSWPALSFYPRHYPRLAACDSCWIDGWMHLALFWSWCCIYHKCMVYDFGGNDFGPLCYWLCHQQ